MSCFDVICMAIIIIVYIIIIIMLRLVAGVNAVAIVVLY